MSTNANSGPAPVLPPPLLNRGAVGWAHDNLFSSWFNSVLTVVSGVLVIVGLWWGLRWVLVDADWTVISTLDGFLAIGEYNTEKACAGQNCFWRPQASLLLVMVLVGMAWGISQGGTARKIAIVATVALAAFAFLPYNFEKMGMDVRLLLVANIPAVGVGWALGKYTSLGSIRGVVLLGIAVFILILVLLRGIPGVPGLQPVSVIYWGGMMLNLLLAVVGIVLSLPIGIALALGRRSRLPVVKALCVAFIEVFRGVPLITLLFMSSVLVPLAFPEDFPLNRLFRAGIIITLFSAAYMAENVRGGLQALHPGQAEAGRALGLPSWQTMTFISLPQAIRNVIPAIVGQFISLFKDTTLVTIIGMLDILEFGRAFIQSYTVGGEVIYLDRQEELFIFIALCFWVFCYGMSYVSRKVEKHLGVGER